MASMNPREKMVLANRLDMVARRLSYNGPLQEQRLKLALDELVMLLGGTGVPAAQTTTPPEGGVEGRHSFS